MNATAAAAAKNVITKCRHRHGRIFQLFLLITCLESLLLFHNVISLAQRVPESVPIFDDSDPIPPRPINVSTSFSHLQPPPPVEVTNEKINFDDVSGSGAGSLTEEVVHEEPSPTVAPSIVETITSPGPSMERAAAMDEVSESSSESNQPTTMSSSLSLWPVETCSNDSDCPSNSTCAAGACTCQAGYCLNDGNCLVNNVPEVICLCKDGFSGPHCQFKDQFCGGRFCLNGGSCSPNGTHCICSSGKCACVCVLTIEDNKQTLSKYLQDMTD